MTTCSDTLPLPLVDNEARKRETIFAHSVLAPLFERLARALVEPGPGEIGLWNTRRTIYNDLCDRVQERHIVRLLPHDLDIARLRDAVWDTVEMETE